MHEKGRLWLIENLGAVNATWPKKRMRPLEVSHQNWPLAYMTLYVCAARSSEWQVRAAPFVYIIHNMTLYALMQVGNFKKSPSARSVLLHLKIVLINGGFFIKLLQWYYYIFCVWYVMCVHALLLQLQFLLSLTSLYCIQRPRPCIIYWRSF